MRALFKTGLYTVLYLLSRLVPNPREVSILMYHAVDTSSWKLSVSPKVFESQIQYLQKQAHIVPLSEVVAYAKREKKLLSRSVAITFDDGYRDILSSVLPIITQYQIPITVFVPSDLSVHTDPDGRARLTEEELRTLSASPLVTIGSHARTHRKLPSLPESELESETKGSRDELAKMLSDAPRFFAYPFGARSKDVEASVEQANYEAAFSITEGMVRPGDDLFRLKRIQVDATMNSLLFKLRLTRAVDWNRKVVDIFRPRI